MNQTEAFRLMMREKEALIADKYRLNDKLNTLRREAKTADEKWQKEKEALEKAISEKSAGLKEMSNVHDRLQNEIVQLKVR